MRKAVIFALLIVILSYSVLGLGLATPPDKNFKAYVGDNLTIKIQILNQEGVPGEYDIYFAGKLAERTKASPNELLISPPSAFNSGVGRSDILIDSKGILPGTYDLKIIAELKSQGESSLSLIQQVTRTITVSYEYPPSFLSKVMNFIILSIKNAINWVIGLLLLVYHKNPWLNYLFLMIVIGIFFYAGTKTKEIMAWLKMMIKKAGKLKNNMLKEKEKIKQKGFINWINLKIKNKFKKWKANKKRKEDNKKDEKDTNINA